MNNDIRIPLYSRENIRLIGGLHSIQIIYNARQMHWDIYVFMFLSYSNEMNTATTMLLRACLHAGLLSIIVQESLAN